MKARIRIIETYHVEVDAEYGDDESSLLEKGIAMKVDISPAPYSQRAVLMPEDSIIDSPPVNETPLEV